MTTLNENIKRTRLQQKMTLDDVAKIVGVSRQTIQRYESGVIGNIPSDRIEKIALALHTTPGALMGWEQAEDQNGYYDDSDIAELAEKLRTDPELKILFSAAADLSPEEMQQAANYIRFLKTERNK
ncbi:helix-turn-helix domain-containing protein [Megasphaera vaginalis (ex Srinivasan et al. 2021)]|uniref:DNA-binding helix-turn-helix protein n=1 Tax=Megasphaera vaginalis (ex Srinivasan et al. 2021) TaxID=1111454 RepID=U7UP57_9FIRM|nr:helix-turn-helix transcriptional regulator [Megasphaera vaginalis (ex Srinivasan et al. 2021)]ERT60258.1 DNA-binding helix-turn-helix protein [Megasphaera vaginalis (ex Srinivasan et al. 2021)]